MKFKELRESKNLTQTELSKKIGVSNRTVSMWETGNSTPKLSTMVKISEVLEVTAADIMECFC